MTRAEVGAQRCLEDLQTSQKHQQALRSRGLKVLEQQLERDLQALEQYYNYKARLMIVGTLRDVPFVRLFYCSFILSGLSDLCGTHKVTCTTVQTELYLICPSYFSGNRDSKCPCRLCICTRIQSNNNAINPSRTHGE